MQHWKPKYQLQFLGGLVGYGVLIPLSLVVSENYRLSLTSKMLLSLMPMLPFLLVIHALVRNYQSMDEFWQKIIAESIIWTASITAFATLSLGLLQIYDFIPAVSLIFVFPYMIAILGLSLFFVRKKYLS